MSKVLVVNPSSALGSSDSTEDLMSHSSLMPLESFFFATIKPEDWEWNEKDEQWVCTKVLEDENGEYIKEDCLSLELELDEEGTNDLINHMPEILIDTTKMSDEELEKLGYTRHPAASHEEFLDWAMGTRELNEAFYDHICRNCLISLTSYDRIGKFQILQGFDKLDKPVAMKISQICMQPIYIGE